MQPLTPLAGVQFYASVNELSLALVALLQAEPQPAEVYVLCDDNTAIHCYPLLRQVATLRKLLPKKPFVVPAGEATKSPKTAHKLWKRLLKKQASRQAILLNLGGGMVSDLGGFVAATYKRGIRSINIPTTTLAMADASVGAKCGINAGGVKNSVGAFHSPEAVLICPEWQATLSPREVRSGMVEMLKHGLIANELHLERMLALLHNGRQMPALHDFETTVAAKMQLVQGDLRDAGPRQALNLGHTIGHALEGYFATTKHPLLHGEAIAYGLVAELFISAELLGLSQGLLRQMVQSLKKNFTLPVLHPKDLPDVLQLLQNDKKAAYAQPHFTLLAAIGQPQTGHAVPETLVLQALQYASAQLNDLPDSKK